ncbi:MAG: flagellar export chaperone FliS [Pseudomonadota bacterium]
MFGAAKNGANAYARVGIETGVAAASPHQLIVMLFEGALVAVSSALQGMRAGDIQHRGQSISRAISIIDNGLRASLDKEAGGDIAHSLDALYDYMNRRLLMANLKNQPDMLEEVYRLLSELKSAWDGIGAPPGSQAIVPLHRPIP